jgi:acetylornithine deacetylase/succinyl-diaminopimelate desuccinylase-like protein
MASAKTAADINVAPLAQEAIALLRDYLTIDTTNPPGDVSKAADWVEQLLQSEGFSTTRAGPSGDKPNVIATLAHRGP